MRMEKSFPSPGKFQELSKTISISLSHKPRHNPKKPPVPHLVSLQKFRVHPDRVNFRAQQEMEGSSLSLDPDGRTRVPLAHVVSDCVKRWFQDTLKEAKAGDIAMQVLVGQMYTSGYGVPKDTQKGRAWISRASRTRSSASEVRDKRPGYNASDSDSDEKKDETK